MRLKDNLEREGAPSDWAPESIERMVRARRQRKRRFMLLYGPSSWAGLSREQRLEVLGPWDYLPKGGARYRF